VGGRARLFYVGVTRARQRLVISRCKHRVTRGKPMPRTPCRFFLDIPDDLLDYFEVKDASPMNVSEMAASANNLLAKLDAIK
jgi:DNA helicase-2/ATP-dependent DNA helicase PcrA